jgi:hypothetical protein
MGEKVIILSLFVNAVYAVMQPGMILQSVAEFLERKLPVYLHEPFFACLTCMGGLWGAVGYWTIYGDSVGEWLVVNVCVIGLNSIIVNTFYAE